MILIHANTELYIIGPEPLEHWKSREDMYIETDDS